MSRQMLKRIACRACSEIRMVLVVDRPAEQVGDLERAGEAADGR